jgi:hypothetical protein
VLGPGHRWAHELLPIYALLERLPATRDFARRLGMVTIQRMTCALVQAVEQGANGVPTVEMPEIKSI